MEVSDYMHDAYVLDPAGDVIITLRNFDAPFPPLPFEEELSPWEEPEIVEPEFFPLAIEEQPQLNTKRGKKLARQLRDKPQASSSVDDEIPAYPGLEVHAAEASEAAAVASPTAERSLGNDGGEELDVEELDITAPEPPVLFQASSAHLRLGSRYFEKALDGPFQESLSASDGFRHIDADDWDIEAFLIVMRIIHGRARQVPRSIDLEMLAKVAAIVDYYECYEIVEPFGEIWYNQIENSIAPKTINKDLTLLLLVTWVFGWSKEFMAVTKIAHNRSKRPLSTMGLPIPERIISLIEEHRQETLQRISSIFTSLLALFREEQPECSEACSSMLLGALERSLFRFHPSSERFLEGHSVSSAIKAARGIKTPTWSLNSRRPHSCSRNLESLLEDRMTDIKELEGLDLASFERRGCQLIIIRSKWNTD